MIHDPITLKQAVALVASHKILLAETEKRTSLTTVLDMLPQIEFGSELKIHLAIGPEGGWTDAELQLFDASGWHRATLGSTILRAETAAIAATAVVAARYL